MSFCIQAEERKKSMKIKNFLKRVASIVLVGGLLLTDSNVTSAADGGLSGGVGGKSLSNIVVVSGETSSVNSSIVKTYPWKSYSSINRAGYRFYCVDNQGNVVSEVFDLILSENTLGIDKLDGGMNFYYSIYAENLASTPVTEWEWYGLTATETGPLGILKANPRREWTEDGITYRDNSLYISTAKEEDGGIIAYILDSSYATANEIANNLISAVYNGNTSDGSNSGKDTVGTTTKSGSSTTVGTTGDSEKDSYLVKADTALSMGNGAYAKGVITMIMDRYGDAVWSDTSLLNAVSSLASIVSATNTSAIQAINNQYSNTFDKHTAYSWLVSQGYSRTDAIIAAYRATGKKTNQIGNATLRLSKEETENSDNQIVTSYSLLADASESLQTEESISQASISQNILPITTSAESEEEIEEQASISQNIIPITTTGESESTDTSAIDELFRKYIKFTNKQAQEYVDKGVYTPTYVIMLNNYKLVVEPILWFKWANNTYQQASIGFKVETEAKVTKEHQDECWYLGGAKYSSDPGAGSSHVEAVKEEATITYKWTYLDDSGTAQTLTVTQTVKEGTDYTGSGNYASCIDASTHTPEFTYDGNTVTWSQSSPTLKNSNKSGSYNGYTQWYATCDNSKYKEDTKWTYGSLRDAIHYCYNKGGVNSQLAALIQVYLPAAMTVTSDVEFDGKTLNEMSESKYTFDGTDLDWLSNNSATYGYGMHVYQANAWFTKTRDDDATTPGVAHAAPRPSDTSGYTGTVGEITIVKTYREWSGDNIGEGEVISEKTYIRYQEPSTIYILNEDTWTLSDWYVSAKTSLLKDSVGKDNTQAKWDDIKGDVYGSRSFSVETYASYMGVPGASGMPTTDGWTDNQTVPASDGGCMVSLDGNTSNTSTLYVLYERANGDTASEEEGAADLTESELYDVTSVSYEIDKETFPGIPSTLEATEETFTTDGDTTSYMIVRGEDKVTLKEFMGNMSVLNNGEGVITSEFINNWYYGPEGGTASTRGYTASYAMNILTYDEDEDKTILTPLDMSLTVAVYHGSKNGNRDTTIDLNTGDTGTATGLNTRISTGTIEIIPYYWMTVSALDGIKSIRYMAGEKNNSRTLGTYNYAEVKFVSQGSLEVTSNMWATDSSLKSDTLKGGALFNISTPDYAKVQATTHQIVWDDFDENGDTSVASITLKDESQTLSSNDATERHNEFVNQLAEDIQDDFEISMYVNADDSVSEPAGTNGSTSANSSSVKVYSGAFFGGSLSSKTGSSYASSDSKYYLSSTGNIVNTSLMETEIQETKNIYTRVFSLPNGNIYYVTGNSYSECDSKMAEIMETARNSDGIYNSNLVCKKGAYDIILLVSSQKDIREAIVNSGALESLVNGIELNTGNDNSAPWCQEYSDDDRSETWYNEGAWLTVLTQKTIINVGIISVTERSLVVDPKLTPKQTSKYNDAIYNSAAFRVDWTGDSDSESYRLGTFMGRDLVGTDTNNGVAGFKNLFGVSNTFYIPNRTVTDN